MRKNARKQNQKRNGNGKTVPTKNGNGQSASRRKRNNIQSRDRVKLSKLVGDDFVQTLKVYPEKELTNGIKIIYSVDISPSSFVGTRMELLSNLYQMYRFEKCHVHFRPQIPDVINGVFITFIDTDPEDRQEVFSKDELLRLAQAHQFAEQVSANRAWHVKMPIIKQDDMFYTGNLGDKRFRKQGRLYIIQIGACTNFEGKKVSDILDLGILSCKWSITFANPQMQSLNRVYDGVSQKDILRTFRNLVSYGRGLVTLDAAKHVAGTRFRHTNLLIQDEILTSAGPGDYQLVFYPSQSTIVTSLKAIHGVAVPYSDSKYQKGVIDRKYIDLQGTTTEKAGSLTDWLENAFQLIKGGISVAKGIYDVVTLVSSVFLAGQDVANPITTSVVGDGSFAGDNALRAYGSVVIHYDGKNKPFIDIFGEYEDLSHATDVSGSDCTIHFSVLAFKLNSSFNAEPIDSTTPSLKN